MNRARDFYFRSPHPHLLPEGEGTVRLRKFRFLSRNGRFAFALPERLLNCAPWKHRAFHPLRKFSNTAHHEEIAELFRRVVICFSCHQIVKCAEHLVDFVPAFAFQFHCHQRSRGLADGAAVTSELDFLQSAVAIEFYAKMNFVTTSRIIAMHTHGRIRELAEVPGPT